MIELLISFLKTAYGQFALAATVIATIWGVCKAVGAFKRWIKETKWWKAHEMRRDSPAQMIELVGELKEELAGIRAEVEQIKEENKLQSGKLVEIDKDMADSLCHQLTREHDFYVEQRGWCGASDKRRVKEIYDRYKSRGRNHLADHYMTDIESLPEHKPDSQ